MMMMNNSSSSSSASRPVPFTTMSSIPLTPIDLLHGAYMPSPAHCGQLPQPQPLPLQSDLMLAASPQSNLLPYPFATTYDEAEDEKEADFVAQVKQNLARDIQAAGGASDFTRVSAPAASHVPQPQSLIHLLKPLNMFGYGDDDAPENRDAQALAQVHALCNAGAAEAPLAADRASRRRREIEKRTRRWAQIRAMIGSHDCNFMTNVSDLALVESMVAAFAAVPYDARAMHAALPQTPVNGDSLRSEQRWIDHAFWVARQFFTEAVFPNGAHLRLTQAFFVISLRLYLGKDGHSSRLIASTAPMTRDANSSAFTLRTRADAPPSSKKLLYHRNNYLPISMPSGAEFELSALPVRWPALVQIDDLWEHDICAIFALTPEFSAGLSVVRPNQSVIASAQPYLKHLYLTTYWPAIATSTSNDALAAQQPQPRVCVLVDECVRKMCTFRSMMYNSATYEIHYRTNAYWPNEDDAAVAGAGAAAAAAADADEHVDLRRPKQQQQRKRRDQGGLREDDTRRDRRRRRRLETSCDEGPEAAAAAPAAAQPSSRRLVVAARRWSFNGCRRSNGLEFWMQPFAKFKGLSRHANLPPRLAADIKAQSNEGYGQGRVPQRHEAVDLASLYPELYMDPEERLAIVRRASAALRTDIVGEVLRLKTAHFEEMLQDAM